MDAVCALLRLPVGHGLLTKVNKHDRRRKRTSAVETRHLSYPDLFRWIQEVRHGTSQESICQLKMYRDKRC